MAFMDIIQLIKSKICNSINVVDIQIIDESAKHADHYFAPSPSHLKLILVSDDFMNMASLKRHKLIYNLLRDEIKLIHAISLHLYTQKEYNLKNQR